MNQKNNNHFLKRRVQLRKSLITYFNMEELQTLCFDLGVDYETWGNQGQLMFARELILFMERHGRIDKLYAAVEKARPHLDFGETIDPEPDLAPSPLPVKTYYEFTGRTQHKQEIKNELRNPHGQSIIIVSGLGGIGKTALVHNIVEEIALENLYSHIFWKTFKTERLVGGRIVRLTVREPDFEDLLAEIGIQCGRMDIAKMGSVEERKTAVKNLLFNQPTLIVLDNLETLPDGEFLVHSMSPILGRSKLIITSRQYIISEQALKIKLQGLMGEEGIAFLKAQARNHEKINNADDNILAEIRDVTGGQPLAMRLVVSQLNMQTIETVLNELKKPAFKSQDYELYQFIYKRLWDMLDTNAQDVLVDMVTYPPLIGAAVKDIRAISLVEPEVFQPAMDKLVKFSLVDLLGALGKERYALHPLTLYFIESDITGRWAEQ